MPCGCLFWACAHGSSPGVLPPWDDSPGEAGMMAREGGLAVPSSLSFSVPFSPDSIASLSQRLPLFPCPNLWKMKYMLSVWDTKVFGSLWYSQR